MGPERNSQVSRVTDQDARSIKRKQRLMWLLVIAFPVIAIPLTIAYWPGPSRSESIDVPVTSTFSNPDYSVRGQGSITSTVGADYKGRAFRQTTLDIEIKGSPAEAHLKATLVTASGATIPCKLPATASISSDSWSTEAFTCPFVEFETLKRIESVAVSETE